MTLFPSQWYKLGLPLRLNFCPPVQQSRTQKRLTKSPLVRSLLVSLGMLVILSGGAFALLVHKGPATGKPVILHQKPTPTAIPMVRIVIKLIDVDCNNSEAVVGHDKFYMMTTFAKTLKPSVDQSHLTSPLDIDDGQDLPFPQNPSIVFDGLVPQGGAIAGGFTAYNDMNNAAWANIGSWTAFITGKVGDALIQGGVDTADPTLVVAGVILDVAVKAWYDIAVPKLNSSNAHQLGYVPLRRVGNCCPK